MGGAAHQPCAQGGLPGEVSLHCCCYLCAGWRALPEVALALPNLDHMGARHLTSAATAAAAGRGVAFPASRSRPHFALPLVQKKATKRLQAAGLEAALTWGELQHLAAELRALALDEGMPALLVRGEPLHAFLCACLPVSSACPHILCVCCGVWWILCCCPTDHAVLGLCGVGAQGAARQRDQGLAAAGAGARVGAALFWLVL